MERTPNLTASEALVMKCIWASNRELSLSDIFQTINEQHDKEWKYQTVSTFLLKLVQKGFIHPRREGHKILYEILIPEDIYVSQQVHDFVHFWHQGSAAQFLLSFYRNEKITKEEIADLREVLAREEHSI